MMKGLMEVLCGSLLSDLHALARAFMDKESFLAPLTSLESWEMFKFSRSTIIMKEYC